MTRIFIDGAEGTTGLRLRERLQGRPEFDLLQIDPALRKDAGAKRELLNGADVVFLCLPDGAARESVSLVENPNTRVIDASTAHRVAPGWAYGLPELSEAHRTAIADGTRVAVPGCHATGFITLVYPLVAAGILGKDALLTCHSVTGYSGGGKKMIAQYEDPGRSRALDTPRQYGLTLRHKHLPEMKGVCMLEHAPIFNPIVSDFYAGMVTTVPLHTASLKRPLSARELWEVLSRHYAGQKLITVAPFGGETLESPGFLDSGALAGRDHLELFVFGHEEQAILVSRFDNLGKGSSGAAVQCLNLMCGLEETAGLSF